MATGRGPSSPPPPLFFDGAHRLSYGTDGRDRRSKPLSSGRRRGGGTADDGGTDRMRNAKNRGNLHVADGEKKNETILRVYNRCIRGRKTSGEKKPRTCLLYLRLIPRPSMDTRLARDAEERCLRATRVQSSVAFKSPDNHNKIMGCGVIHRTREM